MDSIRLSPRLQMVADFVPPCACAADIGTDHGYLPVWLLQNGVVQTAIAADIHVGPLANARKSAAAYDLEERVRFVQADGLQFPDAQAADVITIAGMGGAIEIVGVYKRFQWQSQTAYVWDGLLIYMLANGNPTFIPLTAFFIAYLRVGAEIMSRSTDLDPEIVTFLQGIIILLVASQRFLYFIKKRHDQKMSLRQAEAEEGGAAA